MKNTKFNYVLSITIGALVLGIIQLHSGASVESEHVHGAACSGHDHEEHVEEHVEEHSEHDCSSHAEIDTPKEHEHSASCAEDEQVQVVAASPTQIKRFDIQTSRVKQGRTKGDIRVPGEIQVNADRIVHVVPRAAGVVTKVVKSLGDTVKKDDVLAWIESDELAEAKLDFYSKIAEVGCCTIKLTRSKDIYKNIARLLELLEHEASPNEISKLDNQEMGIYRTQLLSAYAEYLSTRENYNREKQLREKQISSAQEMLQAQTAFKKAESELQSAIDTARYDSFMAYTEAVQEQQLVEFNAIAAEKRLRLKGGDDALVKMLEELVPNIAGIKPCLCDDPDCSEEKIISIEETIGQDKQFGWYALRAPFDGIITEKHMVLGEVVDDKSEVFVIADLSTLWVDLIVNQEVVSLLTKGQPVEITPPGGQTIKTKIDFISPIISSETRTALARVSVANSTGQIRPGVFVSARIQMPSESDAVLVPKETVQLVNDQPGVFVKTTDGFALRQVQVGTASGTDVQILQGLQPGDQVVTRNAFHLKAELSKSAHTGCAGHMH